ncbi:hypothetical protein EV175_005556 [Coemansia sp. RSA 1933]|nr:hypothetical protein EV175_005556 [Coemansia sp. RSA 1933]
MRCVHFLPAVFIVLLSFTQAAPCPGLVLEKRQSGFTTDFGDALDTAVDTLDTAAFDNGSGTDAADTRTDPANDVFDAAPLDGGADNLVGNNFAQIDDSTNIDNSSVEYPGDTQMTDNTGTAVSGNNNDIMPIINAPVTVIINSDDNTSRKMPHPTESRSPPPVPAFQPDSAPKLSPQDDAVLSALASLSPTQLSQLLAANPAPDSLVPPIQRLIEYALAVSQSQF